MSEFKPTPSENREFFKMAYNVPHTLLVFSCPAIRVSIYSSTPSWKMNLFVYSQVKFSTDAIDETDLLEDILRPRVESMGGTLEKVTLSGNHLTPCIQVRDLVTDIMNFLLLRLLYAIRLFDDSEIFFDSQHIRIGIC